MSKLTFYYSAMNAGKSAQLLQKNHNLQSKGFKTVIYTSKFDDRYGTGKVASRIGIEANAHLFDKGTRFLDELDKDPRTASNRVPQYQAGAFMFIDEAQFLTKQQVLDLTSVVDEKNISVFCYGLRTDFKGEPFEGSTYLMSWADEIKEIESFDNTAKKAMMNIRVDVNGNRVWHGTQLGIGLNYDTTHRSDFNLRKALNTGLV